MYQLVKNEITGQINTVRVVNGNTTISIPFDEANVDYQEYLKWIADGNVAQPAENN